MAGEEEREFVIMTEAQKKSRRSRSLALGIALAVFVVVIYFVSFVKMDPSILTRGM